jgi:hypothetical protein
MEVARAIAIAVGLIDIRAQMRFNIDHHYLFCLKKLNRNHVEIFYSLFQKTLSSKIIWLIEKQNY